MHYAVSACHPYLSNTNNCHFTWGCMLLFIDCRQQFLSYSGHGNHKLESPLIVLGCWKKKGVITSQAWLRAVSLCVFSK